jgi:heme/copper-type cytochrome/quinol oxidase subunit 1
VIAWDPVARKAVWKIFGCMLSERLGQWNFWTPAIGFNMTFFPLHQLGLEAMCRGCIRGG